MSTFTSTQKAMAIAPKPTAFLSLCSSVFIVQYVLRDQKRRKLTVSFRSRFDDFLCISNHCVGLCRLVFGIRILLVVCQKYGSKIRFQRSLVLLCMKRDDIINKVHAPSSICMDQPTYLRHTLSLVIHNSTTGFYLV